MVDVCLEMAGPEVARPFVEAARSTHPSLIDQSHRMDSRFGVTNIPQVMWIDETGALVRPPEPGMPMAVGEDALKLVELIGGTEERERYVARLRDWARNGSASEHAMAPSEVIARSQPRSPAASEAAAHFELAQHLWRSEGLTDRAVAHFNAAHERQPDNITYKRQAYSALAVERSGSGDGWNRFRQAPDEGEDWPFVSDFNKDMLKFNPELAARLGLEPSE